VSLQRTAFITAAARGLARGIAIDLACGGYRVAFTYRGDGTSPEATLAAIRARGGDALAIAADHGIAGQTERAIAEARTQLRDGTLSPR